MTGEKVTIWQGVYSSFAEAPANDPIFDGEIWLEKQVKRLERDRATVRDGGFVPQAAKTHDYVLPVVAAMVAVDRRTVRILDFGGGLAASFFSVAGALPDNVAIDFHIVESAGICARGRELLGDDGRIHFHEELPDGLADVDVVHAGSALHYVEDWRGLLARFATLSPAHILLSDLTAGDVETFVTSQSYYGQSVPVRFWDVHEVVSAVETLGYRLVYKSNYVARILGEFTELPMRSLPGERRLKHACHLLFRREGHSDADPESAPDRVGEAGP